MLTSGVFFMTILSASLSKNILGVFPIPSIGHTGFHRAIYNHLSLKGHQITVLTYSADQTNNFENVTEIEIPNLQKIRQRNSNKMRQVFDGSRSNLLKALLLGEEYFHELFEEVMAYVETTLPADKKHFDLVLVDSCYPLIHSLGCKFKVPMIGLSSTALVPSSESMLGNPTHPLFSFDFSQNLDNSFNMYKKLERLFHNLGFRLLNNWFNVPKMDKLTKKHFGSDCPHFDDLRKNITLTLLNTNPVFHDINPQVPAVVEIGGLIHIRQRRPLPEYLQTFLDKSTRGVVYINLGSSTKYSQLPESTTNIIKQVVSELPYDVLWKWDDDELLNTSKNVMTKKWLPQQDLLGHKNIKVYVTHGGLQSIEEAISDCVPMVGMPVFMDQFTNVLQMMKLGVAQGLDYMTMTKDSLRNAIIEVAENNEYKAKLREVKDSILDQPMHGLDKAVWWIEYVLRHNKNSNYSKSASVDMSWSQYLLFDVIAASIVTIGMILYIFRFIIKMFPKL